MLDTTYRPELREMNELNQARFEAKLEQRAAMLETDMRVRLAQLESRMDWRNAALGFWLIQVATVAVVLAMVMLMR